MAATKSLSENDVPQTIRATLQRAKNKFNNPRLVRMNARKEAFAEMAQAYSKSIVTNPYIGVVNSYRWMVSDWSNILHHALTPYEEDNIPAGKFSAASLEILKELHDTKAVCENGEPVVTAQQYEEVKNWAKTQGFLQPETKGFFSKLRNSKDFGEKRIADALFTLLTSEYALDMYFPALPLDEQKIAKLSSSDRQKLVASLQEMLDGREIANPRILSDMQSAGAPALTKASLQECGASLRKNSGLQDFFDAYDLLKMQRATGTANLNTTASLTQNNLRLNFLDVDPEKMIEDSEYNPVEFLKNDWAQTHARHKARIQSRSSR